MFEIHLTVDNQNTERFKSDCKELNIKPIIIDTQNNDYSQIMTSSKYNHEDYKLELNNLELKLKDLNYNVIRSKIEIYPKSIKHENHIYYESHIRLKLKLNINFNTSDLKEYCLENNFHFSKNLLKQNGEYNFQMISYRDRNIDLISFIKIINSMTSYLKDNNILYDKVEIEECIYDTNENIDKNWLKKIIN
jgi:hypothetical protein